MLVRIIKLEDKYIFKNDDEIFLTTPNGSLLEVKKKKHANLIVREIKNNNYYKDPSSIMNLTNFSCNLKFEEKKRIKKKIIEILNFDIVLFRCFEEKELIIQMNKKLNPFMEKFDKCFKSNLAIISSFSKSSKIKSKKFYLFLDKLDNYNLTVLFKLATLTKSVILSYFFVMKDINYNTLFKLTNMEYNYQQKRWGVVPEQENIDKNFYNTLKKISIFFKNAN